MVKELRRVSLVIVEFSLLVDHSRGLERGKEWTLRGGGYEYFEYHSTNESQVPVNVIDEATIVGRRYG